MKKRNVFRKYIFLWIYTMVLAGVFAVLLVLSFSALVWAKEDTGEVLYSLFVENGEPETGGGSEEDKTVEEWILYGNLEAGERYYLEGSIHKNDGTEKEGYPITSLQREFIPQNSSGILILRYRLSQNAVHSETFTTSVRLTRIEEWPEEQTESGLLGTAISRKPAAECRGNGGSSVILSRVIANLIIRWVPAFVVE